MPHAATTASSSGDDMPVWLQKIVGQSEYSTKFRLRRWLLFSGLVLGYSFYYLCRNSLSYVLPVMVNDKSLGLSITQLAATTSIFPIAYGAPGPASKVLPKVASPHCGASGTTCSRRISTGAAVGMQPPHTFKLLCKCPTCSLNCVGRAGASKFISGVLGAKLSPRLMLSIGLMATAGVNILFGCSSSLLVFCVLWAVNGTLQVRPALPVCCVLVRLTHLDRPIPLLVFCVLQAHCRLVLPAIRAMP